MLVDKDGNEHTVYCADFAVSPQAGFRYGMENVEDAGYYDSEAAAHIRAIAQNGYWGAAEGAGSLDAVKRMLVDAYNSGEIDRNNSVSYTHLRAHETCDNLVCRLLLEKNFFNDTATTEIYTNTLVGSVRCV